MKHAKALNIEWLPEWYKPNTRKVNWSTIPQEISDQLKDAAKKKKASCTVRDAAPKHKYVYILGRGKKETKRLRKLCMDINPTLPLREYPKNRGE